MVLDECPPYPCEREYAWRGLELTARWAARCKRAVASAVSAKISSKSAETASNVFGATPLLFGIVQGATFADLRRARAEATVEIGFAGYASGGVSVGEPEPEMMQAFEWSEPSKPI